MEAPNLSFRTQIVKVCQLHIYKYRKRIISSSSRNRKLLYNKAKAPRAATPAIPIGLKVGAAPVDCAEAAELALEAALEADLLTLEAALLALEAALLALLDTEDEIWLADEASEERVWEADERAEEAELPVAVAAEAALVPEDAAVAAQDAAVG